MNESSNKDLASERLGSLFFRGVCDGNFLEVKKLLDGAEAPPVSANIRDGLGQTPLSVAAFFGRDDIVGLLLERGAEVDAEDRESKNTALIEAASRNMHVTALLLLEKGANVNHKNIHRQSALHLAVREGYVDMVSLLLKAGADPYDRTGRGETAFELSESFRRRKIGEILSDWAEEEKSRRARAAHDKKQAIARNAHAQNIEKLDRLLGPRKRARGS